MRLSTDNAKKETIIELKRQLERDTRGDTRLVVRKRQIENLIDGIHVVSFSNKTEDLFEIIWNNSVEALAAEFPDLILFWRTKKCGTF